MKIPKVVSQFFGISIVVLFGWVMSPEIGFIMAIGLWLIDPLGVLV